MKIQKIVSQHRRDFTAIYECQHCAATEEASGYDDHHFHANVIPAMQCKACGKDAAGTDYRPLQPKHAAGEIV